MRHLILFSFILLFVPTLRGQDLYLKYDPAYLDKLEYRFTENSSDVVYSTYRLNKNTSEKIFFETGLEGNTVKNKVPGKLENSYDVALDQNDVAAINSGTKKVFIVKPVKGGYVILPVGNAEFMYFSDGLLAYEGTDYKMQADFKAPLPENLSTAGSTSEVYYAGNDQAYGKEVYLFKRSPMDHTCKLNSNLTIMPEIGLIDEKVGDNSNFRLTSVNGMSVDDYLKKPEVRVPSPPTAVVEPTSNVALPATYSTVTTQPEVVTPAPVESVVDPCNLVASEGEHVVQNGESLYSLARRYRLTIAQLRAWNQIPTGSNVIYPCSKLSVVSPVVAAPVELASKNVAVPQTYSAVERAPDAPCKLTAREGEHIVQAGETMSSIGRLYGVSLHSLKQWNESTMKHDAIYPCQRLMVSNPYPAAHLASKGITPTVSHRPKIKNVNKAPAIARVIRKPKQATDLTSKGVSEKTPLLYVKKGLDLHVVKHGETVASLAKEYNVTESQFRSMNKLGAGESVRSGQVVHTKDCACNTSMNEVASLESKKSIPSTYSYTYPHASGSTLTAKGETKKPASKYHVVQEDETLQTISERYGLPIEKLRKLNGLDKGEVVLPNQLLTIQ